MRRAMAVGVMVLAGCAKPADDVDYGPPPTNIEAPIRTYFEDVLKDPESARYRFGAPVRGYINDGLLMGGGVAHVGYIVDVAVNAKNSFGGYTGFKGYTAVFERGRLVNVVEGLNHPLITRVGGAATAPSQAPVVTAEPKASFQPLMR